jgi:FkbM family methyltransferase
MKKYIKSLFNTLGYEIRKTPHNINILTTDDNTMLSGLERSKKWINKPFTIMDVGAAAGTWTEKTLKIWGDSNYILFEPLQERETDLNILKSKYPNNKIDLVFKLVGESKGTVPFTVSEDLDGSGVYQVGGGNNVREIEVTSIDETVKGLNASAPYVIKLDTHGYEIPIIKGAMNTLKQTELIIIEVYGFYVSPTAVLFWEVCQYLDNLGFRLVDLVDTMRRSKDNAFWQCDMFFLKKESKIFDNNQYD